ncbi:DNA repair photolyase [Rhodanobacter thiooxydans]|uniref:DNA repair photolyase n=1 Tax=Rhodanobacter thiooxydans TaxID=416169 RepID=A0A154QLB4_9GAMM|nr:PA0069 family radical SAM protein [Rhodanobacter thiooxydans]EIL97177.1 DNA repair photolyase [Rhodanobacter thiooxydans LCS2]KZC25077.1 DNA repair photolyase [Rhodanobacter thiooxydans]MCW0203832.1 PA0069 family radical SAM protein [Rhodanobacter thiooxydans]
MDELPPSPSLPTVRAHKGRGAASNPEGRFESIRHHAEDDGWQSALLDEAAPRPRTEVTEERAKSVITRNDSPDIAFEQAMNPYRGCEHGCVYCFARPSHSYLNLSPGLDFETKIRAKGNLAEVLRTELAKPGYSPKPINIGSNTDPYQPIEKKWRLTRAALEVLAECRHPCTLVTKNALVERDLDILAEMARGNLVQVFVSVNSLDNHLAAKLEPRASAPHRRLKAIAALAEAGVPVGVLVAPIIPALNDKDMEAVLERAHAGGARCAGYTVLRLPWELKQLFREWLALHAPQRAEHVMSLVQQMNGGRDYDSDFRTRMRGQGVFADLLRKRFELACRRHGYGRARELQLDTSRFVPPPKVSPQGELF